MVQMDCTSTFNRNKMIVRFYILEMLILWLLNFVYRKEWKSAYIVYGQFYINYGVQYVMKVQLIMTLITIQHNHLMVPKEQ